MDTTTILEWQIQHMDMFEEFWQELPYRSLCHVEITIVSKY